MSDIKIIDKKEAPLLSRTEVRAELSYSGVTPKREEIKTKLASSLSAKENLMVIKKIQTKFGDKKARILCYLYNNEKDLLNIEPKKGEKKKKEKAAAGKKEPEKKG